MTALGIIAGGGELPRAVAQAARESGRDSAALRAALTLAPETFGSCE